MIRRIAQGLMACLVLALLIVPSFAPYYEDGQGPDILNNFLQGGRLSVAGGLLATMLALTFGFAVGAAAGLGRRWIDEALMRGTELFQSLPWLYLLIAVRAVFPLQLSPREVFWFVPVIIAIGGWTGPAKLIRGLVLSAKGRPYIQFARSMGAGNAYILVHHILPQLRGLLFAQALVIFPRFVLAEMALSFLGLGADQPAASWGGLLAQVRNFSAPETYWRHVTPVLVMILFFAAMEVLRQPSPIKAARRNELLIEGYGTY